MSEGIKETTELLDALAVLVKVVGKIGADKKVNLGDLKYLGEAIKDIYDVVLESKDKELIIKEFKDLDEVETAIILAKVFEILKAGKGVA